MPMGEFRTLAILARFRGVFTKMGIDYGTMETILRMKLTMDGRRVPTIFNDMRKQKDGNQFLKSLWIYGIYGLMIIPFLFIGDQYMFQMSIVFGIMMFVLTTTMVSDFSSVLLDVRDKTVLQTKPIDGRTIAAAKLIHIMLYMFFITGAFIALPLLVSLFKKGIVFTLIFIIGLVFALLFIVVFTSLLYFFVLKFFDGEKLKDIINYVQILLSVGVIVGYQIVIRSFSFVDLDITYTFNWWHVLLPPMWFAAPFELILNQNYSTFTILFTLLAILIPLIAIFIYSKLTTSFERNLDKLMGESKNKNRKPHMLDELWMKLICRSKEEKVFFRFTALMMKQERQFKLKVYPSFGFAIIFPFIFIFTELQTRSLADISKGNTFLFIYFGSIMIPTIIHMLRFSANYKGSWIFKAAPLQNPNAAYSGTLKAFLAKLYIPVFLLLSIIFIWIFGFRIAPHLLAVLLGASVQTLLTYKFINAEPFPFMNSFETVQSDGSMKLFLLSLLTGLFVVAHLIANAITGGIYGYIAILLVTLLIGWRKVFAMKDQAIQ